VANGGKTPNRNGKRVSSAHPEDVDQPSGKKVTSRIQCLEPKNGIAILLVVEAQVLHQTRLEDADYLPVEVADRGAEKQQSADPPSILRCNCSHRVVFAHALS